MGRRIGAMRVWLIQAQAFSPAARPANDLYDAKHVRHPARDKTPECAGAQALLTHVAHRTHSRLRARGCRGSERDRTAVYSTSGISKSFLVRNSTRPVATAAGFLPGKSWLARGIDTVSISGIHCCSRWATSKNTGNVSLPRIDSTGC